MYLRNNYTIYLPYVILIFYEFSVAKLYIFFKKKKRNATFSSVPKYTLYAVWEIVTYNITYNLNGGINNSTNPSKYTVEDTFTLETPSRAGYTFAGWYNPIVAAIGRIVSNKPVNTLVGTGSSTYGIHVELEKLITKWQIIAGTIDLYLLVM